MELITIGEIVKPQGVKGEVKIKLFTENAAAIKKLKHAYLAKGMQKKAIKTVSARDGFAYILFEGVADRNAAELLRGSEVYVEEANLEIEDENTFYVSDIVGCTVNDEQGNLIGELVDVEQYGAADVWIVRSKGRNYSFPYIGSIVASVNIKEKLIVLNKKAFDEGKICE